jgi:hypothetical protein
MAPLILLSLLAAPLGSASVAGDGASPTAVAVTARASVRIIPGARVVLGDQAKAGEYRIVDSTVTAEDGRRRPAKLVEFQ